MCGVTEAGDGRLWVLIGPVFLKQPTEHVLGDLLPLLGDVGTNADIKMGATRPVGARYFVQKIREPKQVVLVAHHPVKVYASVILVG